MDIENKNKAIKSISEQVAYSFWNKIAKKDLEKPNITDSDIYNILHEYFNKPTLTEAIDYYYSSLNKYVPDTWDQIDHSLSREEKEKTHAFKQWLYHSDINQIWYNINYDEGLEEMWVDLNGKCNTNEEAAKKAADKWCELIFGWHLQDNGALNEDHPGGFQACALATVLGNSAKEKITEEMKKKAYENFYQYYLHGILFNDDFNMKHIEWLKKTFPDPDGKFDWKYGFNTDVSCDYDPSWPLYLILLNSGIPNNLIHSICPWKTGIRIRHTDNAVMLNTYQHREQI